MRGTAMSGGARRQAKAVRRVGRERLVSRERARDCESETLPVYLSSVRYRYSVEDRVHSSSSSTRQSGESFSYLFLCLCFLERLLMRNTKCFFAKMFVL